ncbi:helicase-related protein [Nonomuraea sp. JJY05]|uniref:helicase-related protein n=1 Tax=Nonomuraea sp. JJY05 TaxID=3350255 RepID=UPI00373FBD73
MPEILDNIDAEMLAKLRNDLPLATALDISVGYFSLTGWGRIADLVENLQPQGRRPAVRLLIGMLGRNQNSGATRGDGIDVDPEASGGTAYRERKDRALREFKRQLARGIPSQRDHHALRALKRHIKDGHLEVKLFLRHPLHAKLYLCHLRQPATVERSAYVGSSNLSNSGLKAQGELNVTFADNMPTKRLEDWFEDRWEDYLAVSVDESLLDVLEDSWARERPYSPHHVYLKMAYHLASEAIAGSREITLPEAVRDVLLDFQADAIKIADRHLRLRGGVLIGDVVGLGKTLVGISLALSRQEREGDRVLVICPKNLAGMWEAATRSYGLRAKVLSLSRVLSDLDNLSPIDLVVIDESHNLRNRDGKIYAKVQSYIKDSGARAILLSATPYNKSVADLAGQLGLFLDDDTDLGIRPEAFRRRLGNEAIFLARCGGQPTTLKAFRLSDEPEDWQELMRLFLVRRTRSFIRQTYATTAENGRQFLEFKDGHRFFFPERVPRTIHHRLRGEDDPAAVLMSEETVDAINQLKLPRYGLQKYVDPDMPVSESERADIEALSRAGDQLRGLTRSGLFKRLESSGHAFVLSAKRHIAKNLAVLYALQSGLPVPVAGAGSTNISDQDIEDSGQETLDISAQNDALATEGENAYAAVIAAGGRRLRLIPSTAFVPELAEDLAADVAILREILAQIGPWNTVRDSKVAILHDLITQRHLHDRVLIFTEFADTAEYIGRYLEERGIEKAAVVTGETADPSSTIRRFSPSTVPGLVPVPPGQQLRILVATDVISEGQNLQDASIVVNYDLPWAIIRLVQRAGRVDRIGQQDSEILVYSFVPHEGIEQILRLHARIYRRLRENNEVIGGDERFFDLQGESDGISARRSIIELLAEDARALDDVDDSNDVDLGSYAYMVWERAKEADPSLESLIPALPSVIGATKLTTLDPGADEGALAYIRTRSGLDVLVKVDLDGTPTSFNQMEILRAAYAPPEAPSIALDRRHHELVAAATQAAEDQTRSITTAGVLSGVAKRVHQRLLQHLEGRAGTLFSDEQTEEIINVMYTRPLTEEAIRVIRNRLRENITTAELVELVGGLHEDGRLVRSETQQRAQSETQIICSMGLFSDPVPEETP